MASNSSFIIIFVPLIDAGAAPSARISKDDISSNIILIVRGAPNSSWMSMMRPASSVNVTINNGWRVWWEKFLAPYTSLSPTGSTGSLTTLRWYPVSYGCTTCSVVFLVCPPATADKWYVPSASAPIGNTNEFVWNVGCATWYGCMSSPPPSAEPRRSLPGADDAVMVTRS